MTCYVDPMVGHAKAEPVARDRFTHPDDLVVRGREDAEAKNPWLSPINQRRWANFKANKRGYWSLWIFMILFIPVAVRRIHRQ